MWGQRPWEQGTWGQDTSSKTGRAETPPRLCQAHCTTPLPIRPIRAGCAHLCEASCCPSKSPHGQGWGLLCPHAHQSPLCRPRAPRCTHGMRLSLWSARMAPRSRSTLPASSPSCPLSLCLARYQPLPWGGEGLRAGGGRGHPGEGGAGSGSSADGPGVPSPPSHGHGWPPRAPRVHLHGLDDGDHIPLAEGQLAGLGLVMVVLGDALRPWGPVFLQGRKRHQQGQRGQGQRGLEACPPPPPMDIGASPGDPPAPWPE